ncbi:uncharacterized protein KGF55_004462 [Candida pseudojiufengensis]|uniref:uncharacterized protein n=1 Tax=Candida pseudojiufengensis TaxID=497109 RepID=UPI002224CEFF|nr:uncharacterized protein KGF55_004462 [Candida pseudojiufengensis]KAI5960569.1 hypothetical protein KGF55_004462 [Candida pseudojiufengensis]
MAKEKRTKPCCNCKRSKVRCVYQGTLPCQRCLNTGQAATCQFVPKLPSLKLPSFEPTNPPVAPLPLSHFPTLNHDSFSTFPGVSTMIPQVSQYSQTTQPGIALPNQITTIPPLKSPATDSSPWKKSIEQRLDSFESKVDLIADLLKSQQQPSYHRPSSTFHNQRTSSPEQTNLHNLLNQNSSTINSRNSTPELHYSSYVENNKKRNYIDQDSSPRKRSRVTQEDHNLKDFRHGFLSKDEASELFNYFDTHIAKQLFGFEISKFNVNDIWDTCPVLVCAISTIASIHHPTLNTKSLPLQGYLRDLCGSLFFTNKPKNKSDAFNTIVALILCSFWLSDSQMFTGLALQIAKEYGLNNANCKNKDDLKLWYLLYILDGQQSLAFHRQPLVNSHEYSLKHSRKLLVDVDEKKLGDKNNQLPKIESGSNGNSHKNSQEKDMRRSIMKQKLTDLRLVSQVEYNQALNEAFRGDAWDLLLPSSFGIPSKSNLELDKWMVSWTVLLSPASHGAIWSAKSTLIYYNFAKIHINSSAVRQLSINPNHDTSLPKWDGTVNADSSNLTTPTPVPISKKNHATKIQDNEEDSDDSESSQDEDEEEFISNRELLSPDEAAVNANVALNAAHTVLNLVINDKDILDNLRYVPVHVHIMLYYAALILINPPSKSNNISIDLTESKYYLNLLDNLRIVNLLKKKIYSNLPIDMKFGTRLIKSLEDLEIEKLNEIKIFANQLKEYDLKNEFDKKINSFIETSENIQELMESNESGGDSSRASTPLPEKISAWPGSNHGHP